MSQRRDLAGQVVVVTGAARGLGCGLAEQLAARGARVALLGLEAAELSRVRGVIGAERARAWPLDVTDPTALHQAAEQVCEHFGRVDVVVANAGIATGGLVGLADPGAYERTVEVNLLGSIRTARAFLPALVAARGYLLQVASMAAMVPVPGMSAYCVSKTAVETFAHCLRGEVAHHGVAVGVAYLSWIDTDMVRGADAVPALAQLRGSLKGPFARTYPLDVAVGWLVDGVQRRSAHIYGPPWLRAVQPMRPLLPALTAWQGRRLAPQAEALMRGAGPEASQPVGAGGRADAERGPATIG